MSTETVRLVRDRGTGGYGGGGRGMGSDESHFNVSLIVRAKVTRQCPQTTTLLKRKESRSGIGARPNRLTYGDFSKYTWCLTSTETIRLIRDGARGYGGGGEGDYIPIATQ